MIQCEVDNFIARDNYLITQNYVPYTFHEINWLYWSSYNIMNIVKLQSSRALIIREAKHNDLVKYTH